MTRARILADYVAGGTTATEFDYMDGVTSNVQTQLDAKLPLAGGTMTGNIVMGDDTSIGIADDAERIEFDGAGDISVLGANVGIGTDAPDDLLHVYKGDSGAAPHTDSVAVIENSGNCVLQLLTPASDASAIYFGDPAHTNDGGIIYHQNSRYMSFRTGDAERLRIASDGKVGVGRTDPTAKFEVYDTGNSATILRAYDGASRRVVITGGNSYAMEVYSTATNMFIDKSDGAGTLVAWGQTGTIRGYVTVDAGTVTYGAFTGGHNGKILEDEIIAGSILTVDKCTLPEGSMQPEYEFKYSTTANDPKVLGVVGSTKKLEGIGVEDQYLCYSLGDGGILVTDSAGDINAGDYLTSSVRSGHAVPQESGAMMNYTIAKSLVDVDWSTIDVDADLGYKSKLIPCTYHCG